MIQVYKCDFCHHFNQDAEKVITHEIKCSFNPINKNCYTCKFYYDAGGMYGSMPMCEKKLSTYEGIKAGNCMGWELEQ